MANGGLGSVWTRLLQEVDHRIAKALANIGVVGTTINAGNIAGEFNPTLAETGKAKVSANDTTAGYLNGKLVAGTNITFNEGSDGGDETLTIAASGGGIATDTIWDAKGDLAAGTGADTAQRLAVGTDGYFLVADSSQTTGLRWAKFPELLTDDGGTILYDDSDNLLYEDV